MRAAHAQRASEFKGMEEVYYTKDAILLQVALLQNPR